MKKNKIIFLIKNLLMLFVLIAWENDFYSQILHSKNQAARLNIDAKAAITPTHSKEALARSREFIQIDSTYFLGYMYEGIYKVRHAQDLIGFKNAAEPLEYAYQLILRDYKKELTRRTKDVFDVYYSFQLQMYFQEMVYALWESYMNAQEFQKAYDLTMEVAHLNLQLEYYFQSYTHIAWIVHKLRMYSSNDYPFLKDDVLSNVQLAMIFIDSAYEKAAKDEKLNAGIFDIYSDNLYSIAHYQAILYTYLFQMDSATYYYDKLKSRGYYSHNNRGNFLYISGKFRLAEEEYNNAHLNIVDDMSKELKEHVYFTSFIKINKGANRSYIYQLSKTLEYENSKPGYGWYNMAMARTLMYSGQRKQAEPYLKKAENFKELHIGTTLGNEHYQMSLYSLKYIDSYLKLKEFKKQNEGWYWNPINWFRVAGMAFDKYITRYNLVSILAENPEREYVLYPIFASESVIYWDEVMNILAEINPEYFISYYEKEIKENNQRPSILPYQKLILARLYIIEDEWEKADALCEEILMDAQIDNEYEGFLIANTMALKSKIEEERGNDRESKKWFYQMYLLYPSLAKTEDGELDIYIQNKDSLPKDILDAIKDSDLNIVNEINEQTIVLSIQYKVENERHYATLIVADSEANIVISEVQLKNDSIDELGEEIYAALFGYFPLSMMESEE